MAVGLGAINLKKDILISYRLFRKQEAKRSSKGGQKVFFPLFQEKIISMIRARRCLLSSVALIWLSLSIILCRQGEEGESKLQYADGRDRSKGSSDMSNEPEPEPPADEKQGNPFWGILFMIVRAIVEIEVICFYDRSLARFAVFWPMQAFLACIAVEALLIFYRKKGGFLAKANTLIAPLIFIFWFGIMTEYWYTDKRSFSLFLLLNVLPLYLSLQPITAEHKSQRDKRNSLYAVSISLAAFLAATIIFSPLLLKAVAPRGLHDFTKLLFVLVPFLVSLEAQAELEGWEDWESWKGWKDWKGLLDKMATPGLLLGIELLLFGLARFWWYPYFLPHSFVPNPV